MLTNPEIVTRIVIAGLMGALIGFERERSRKVAGLRTHSLVAIGSALLSLISIFMFEQFPSVNGVGGFDYHLIANVIVGIGFIGGGAILRTGSRVVGTTTAATLWVVAAIGIACGIGFYYGAMITAVVVYFILTVIWKLENRYFTKESENAYRAVSIEPQDVVTNEVDHKEE